MTMLINQLKTVKSGLLVPTGDRKNPRPFLKWVGGKSQIIEKIKENLPREYNRYFEPFLGGGAVFFKAIPWDKQAVLSDINGNLVGAFSDIKANFDEVIFEINNLINGYKNLSPKGMERFYYDRRDEYNSIRTPSASIKRTALLIFLNKTCYNGVYRENSKGEFNVPIGYKTLRNIFNNENLELVAKKLKSAKIVNMSYKDILDQAQRGDLIYLDPPYNPLTKTANFTKYNSADFGPKDQIELRDLFMDLDNRGCYLIMSNSDTELTRSLYSNYASKIVRVEAARTVNCHGSSRKPVGEVLIKNF